VFLTLTEWARPVFVMMIGQFNRIAAYIMDHAIRIVLMKIVVSVLLNMTAGIVPLMHGEMRKVYVPVILTGVMLLKVIRLMEIIGLAHAILANVTLNAKAAALDPQIRTVYYVLSSRTGLENVYVIHRAGIRGLIVVNIMETVTPDVKDVMDPIILNAFSVSRMPNAIRMVDVYVNRAGTHILSVIHGKWV